MQKVALQYNGKKSSLPIYPLMVLSVILSHCPKKLKQTFENPSYKITLNLENNKIEHAKMPLHIFKHSFQTNLFFLCNICLINQNYSCMYIQNNETTYGVVFILSIISPMCHNWWCNQSFQYLLMATWVRGNEWLNFIKMHYLIWCLRL